MVSFKERCREVRKVSSRSSRMGVVAMKGEEREVDAREKDERRTMLTDSLLAAMLGSSDSETTSQVP